MANKKANETSKIDKMAKSVAASTAKKPSKDKSPKDKSSFGKDFRAELKRVTWPTPKQLVNNTTAVIVIVLITAAIVFVLDVIFENINKYGVEGLKAVVKTETTTSEEDSSLDGTEYETNYESIDEEEANVEVTSEETTEDTTQETTEE